MAGGRGARAHRTVRAVSRDSGIKLASLTMRVGDQRKAPVRWKMQAASPRAEPLMIRTAASVRTVHLPAFLVTTSTAHQDIQQREHVFTGADGGLLRRSKFRRRHWRPALVRAGLLGTVTFASGGRSPGGMGRSTRSGAQPHATEHDGGCRPDQRQRS
jgi:hypothetical protein